MTSSSSLRPRDMTAIALMAVLITVCAWLTVPGPVPFTMQSFAVALALLTLGGRRGLWAVGVYLAMGAVGLPVFSGMRGGLGILLGSSGGFLLGFLGMAAVYRLGAKEGRQVRTLAALLLGQGVCYGVGAVWFAFLYGGTIWSAALACVAPFLLPDGVKLMLAYWVSKRLRPFRP